MALEEWIAVQARRSASFMLQAISATQLLMERSAYGQRIRPLPGSVLASPVIAHYDPEPDYFFHWFRDAAIVIDALRVALLCGYTDSGSLTRFGEFVDFSHALHAWDGRAHAAGADVRAGVKPEFVKFLRPQNELAALDAESILADTRLNPDGTPDITRWGRPQTDGPALQVMVLQAWLRDVPQLSSVIQARTRALVEADLRFTLQQAAAPSFDIWEEECGQHYYHRLLQAQACRQGASCLPQQQRELAETAGSLTAQLDEFWSPADGFYRSRRGVTDGAPAKALDASVLLAYLHAGRSAGAHSLLDPKAQATVVRLEALFESTYAINRALAPDRAPAMGRYHGDHYYSGGAWYITTLGAAEFYYRLAEALSGGAALAETHDNEDFIRRLTRLAAADASHPLTEGALQRGDAFMRTVHAFTPADGSLSEQFSQADGAQTSARHLAWSYAAFITAASARERVCRSLQSLGSAAPR
jgi:glucoamylase